MSDILYTAALIVPVTGPPLVDGALHVRDGRIVAVGPAADLQRRAPSAEVVDFGSAVMMPSLVNAHTHLELTDFPDWAEQHASRPGEHFVDWILDLIRIKQALEPDQLARSVRNGLEQLLRTGTGAVCDILSVPALDHEYADSPLHGWLCYELIGLDDGMGAVLPAMAGDWLNTDPPAAHLQRGLSPHSPYTVGPQTLSSLAEMAAKRHTLMTIHAAESPDEVAFLAESRGAIATGLYPAVGWSPPQPPYGQGPIDYLTAGNALSGGTLLVHGVQFDDSAVRKIARSGSSLVLCPRSNSRLGVGRAPVEACLCQGVNLALGTDSPASSDSLSLWDEMAFALDLYREVLPPEHIVAAATINGALALGLESEFGALDAGYGAHFLVLEPERLPELDAVGRFLCQPERANDIVHHFLDGRDVLTQEV